MAKVAPETARHIEIILSHLTERWAELPTVVQTIDQWDPVDQSLFRVEWPLEDEHLEMLREYIVRGLLDPAQLERYHELERLMAQNQPVLDRLFEGWITVAESRRRQGLEPLTSGYEHRAD
jgi:hypothetical protein